MAQYPSRSITCGVRIRFGGNVAIGGDFNSNLAFAFYSPSGDFGQRFVYIDYESISLTSVGGIITDDQYRIRLWARDTSGNLTLRGSVDNPFPSPIIGTASGYPRSDWGWHDLSLKLRTSSYDDALGGFQADGYLAVKIDDDVIIVEDLALVAPLLASSAFVDFRIQAKFDTDAPWVAEGLGWATGYDADRLPTGGVGNFILADALDATFSGWEIWDVASTLTEPYLGDDAGNYYISSQGDDADEEFPVTPALHYTGLKRELELSADAGGGDDDGDPEVIDDLTGSATSIPCLHGSASAHRLTGSHTGTHTYLRGSA